MNAFEVKLKARQFGADLVGIASMESFNGVAPANHPAGIFPQGRCVIVIGRKIPRGTLRMEETCHVQKNDPYHFFGFTQLEDQFLTKSTYDLCVWIESQGFEAVPMFGYDAEAAANFQLASPVSEGKPAPNVYVDYQIAAQAAGLGSIGQNGIFLTKEYGPLQRFSMLICDDELECDAPILLDFCNDCQECKNACPLAALGDIADAKGVVQQKAPRFRRDNSRCKVCQTGAWATDIGRFETVDRFAAACCRACLASLERRGLLTHKMNQPFRQEAR